MARPVLQLHVRAQFYLESKGKYILEAWGHAHPKDTKRRKAPSPILAPLFMFFLLPLGLPYVNWASQEYCLFYLRSSLQSWDLPLFYFCGFFPSFSHHHSVLLFPILTTFKGFKLPKGAFLSEFCASFHMHFSFPINFTSLFTFDLLTWILSWQSRHEWGTLALTAGLCGPVVRTSSLGTKILLLATAYCCIWPKSRKTIFRK